MVSVRVSYFPKKCIGNGSCARIDPLRFALIGKKAQLRGGAVRGEAVVLEQDCSDADLKRLVEAATHCPVNAIKVDNVTQKKILVGTELKETPAAQTIRASYDDAKEFTLDSSGYFLIRTKPETKEIEVALCAERNVISKIVVGKTPLEIYQTCIREKMLSRHDHAAYLGRELQKANIALQAGVPYVQDDELKF